MFTALGPHGAWAGPAEGGTWAGRGQRFSVWILYNRAFKFIYTSLQNCVSAFPIKNYKNHSTPSLSNAHFRKLLFLVLFYSLLLGLVLRPPGASRGSRLPQPCAA